MQSSELRGKQEIGARTKDDVPQKAVIPAENFPEVVLIGGEAADVTGKGVVFGEDAIQFQLWS